MPVSLCDALCATQLLENEVSQFRGVINGPQRRLHMWTDRSSSSASAGTDGGLAAAVGGGAPLVTFRAAVEQHAVPVPLEVLTADIATWFDNPHPLA